MFLVTSVKGQKIDDKLFNIWNLECYKNIDAGIKTCYTEDNECLIATRISFNRDSLGLYYTINHAMNSSGKRNEFEFFPKNRIRLSEFYLTKMYCKSCCWKDISAYNLTGMNSYILDGDRLILLTEDHKERFVFRRSKK
jgi:hypothetical protein